MRVVAALRTVCLILAIILTNATFSEGAGVPQIINYQGTLTDKTGAPVPDGDYSIQFSAYSTATGGSPLWTETWNASTNLVHTISGTFNVMLGTHNPFPATFFVDYPTTYLGVKVVTDSEMLPRQRIASVGYALAAANGIPKGGIIMWSGTLADIPPGWALCDGTNGTPDLKDRFIVGAGNTYSIGDKEGATSHVHGINAEAPGTNQTGSHTHHVSADVYSCIGDCDDGADDGSKDVGSDDHGHHLELDTQANGNHSHVVNSHAHGGGTLSTKHLPPYFALAYIMKL